jgi:hypothetical protein
MADMRAKGLTLNDKGKGADLNDKGLGSQGWLCYEVGGPAIRAVGPALGQGGYPSGDVTSGQSEDCLLYCSSLYTTGGGLCIV